jgi:hypothetical protein
MDDGFRATKRGISAMPVVAPSLLTLVVVAGRIPARLNDDGGDTFQQWVLLLPPSLLKSK